MRFPNATGPPHLKRMPTAAAAKHQAAAVLTTTLPNNGTIMASNTLTLPDAQAKGPAGSLVATSILALDLGTTTGWALRSRDGEITSGTVSFKPSRYEGGGIRYLRFRSWLEELTHYVGAFGAVHFEEVRRHAGTDAAHVYGGLLGTLTSWCEHREIAYQAVPVGTIKRFATGKGNADKVAMLAAIRQRGFAPSDDNEADALAILLWAMETRGGLR
jgi:hypothetical protein